MRSYGAFPAAPFQRPVAGALKPLLPATGTQLYTPDAPHGHVPSATATPFRKSDRVIVCPYPVEDSEQNVLCRSRGWQPATARLSQNPSSY